MILDPNAITPLEYRHGLVLKRDDLHRDPVTGANGSKYRACRHLIGTAASRGVETVVSACSVRSPQAAIVASLATEYGLAVHQIYGSTKMATLGEYAPARIAIDLGAHVEIIGSGFNNALQKAARERVAEDPERRWAVPYAISPPLDAPAEEIGAFLAVNAAQVESLPDEIETLVIPAGSGNTAASILYGLAVTAPRDLRRVVLAEIGFSPVEVARRRLAAVGLPLLPEGVDLVTVPRRYDYAKKIRRSFDGVDLHPTYEAKVFTTLDDLAPEWWTRRDGTTAVWIVGGPL